MKKKILIYGMLVLLIASCRKTADKSQQKLPETQHNQEERGQVAAKTTAAATIDVFRCRRSPG